MNSIYEKGLRISQVAFVSALLLCTVLATEAVAEMPALTQDGWHTWQVPAPSEAPKWCCLTWRNDDVAPDICNLDSANHSYSQYSRDTGKTDNGDYQVTGDSRRRGPVKIQVYAKMVGGQPRALHALTPGCPVSTNTAVHDLGNIAADDSVAWLETQVNPRSELSSDALAAIAMHAGNKAINLLVRTATDNASIENRRNALFWMGQVRAKETGSQIESLMFHDPLPVIREHAAFSLSQSRLPGSASRIAQLAGNDTDPDVRGKAWFWYAETGVNNAGVTLIAALTNEENQNVREKIIFAMSQLPDDLAADALIGVAADRTRPGNDRERALFWIAQSDADRALNYLTTLLETP